ncbi:MAG: hypothetical protein HON53_18620 [Planctomycetaceae bacterium]|nr:hypothetical protein [Planctomycetaceae bacterium]MBT6153629.1 hypothetical protein [Planctomycetaceae bacterium]MBT6484320.1 hypothetical protein [Planctomycetaceae bacterium]MBT6496650.1 hypothetical protein [Planctomycetaceae bacterium]
MQSDEHASISVWVGGLKDGDADAAQQIWERFFDRLVSLASCCWR